MKLTATNVSNIFNDCLFKERPSNGDQYIPTEGLTISVGFNPKSIELHAEEIKQLLDELPHEFNEKSGGGWSFLNACCDKDGNHWAEHKNIQELLMLGLASGYASYILPRELWSALPGGVPYFMVKNEREVVKTEIYND